MAGPGPPPEEGILSVLREDGRADPSTDPGLPEPLLRALFEGMLRVRLLDERLVNLQRQGRVAFHAGARGQEASAVGAAAALEPSDLVFPGLRETGVLIYRGAPLEALLAQSLGRATDPQKGRQMPCHASDRQLNVVSASTSVGSQLPHAVGAAYAARLRGERVVAAAFFGDGATSTGDFHAALNLAGLWGAPVVFLCQNNGWAISLPVERQTASDSLAVKAGAYGFPGRRVDGADVLAVYASVREAAERARRGDGPALLELLTDRPGPHSTADDTAHYREEGEGRWGDPVGRFRAYLDAAGLWSEEREAGFRERFEGQLSDAIRRVEQLQPPGVGSLFEDVWEIPTRALEEQRGELGSEPRGSGPGGDRP